MEPSLGNQWVMFGLGFLGILLHLVKSVMDEGGKTIQAFAAYTVANSLVVVLSVGTYVAVAAIWYEVGLDFLGMDKGHLSALVIPVAYCAQSLFGSFVAKFEKKAQAATNQAGAPQ